ncbi:MAG: aminotransferase class I/II-fold pyridoxal phosphate-dependent enzyme [Caldilineae bacterium]|nr:MAG: aminotransferase class I/II-fold pyridoxal phosphate-dependent enzyme [Caldilineae bacterium]
MKSWSPDYGLGTLVNHYDEGDNPLNAHITPIYQTSTFAFPDAETAGRVFAGKEFGYTYTRNYAPNADQLARKYALLEALDLLRQHPDREPGAVVAARAVSAGMAAISSAILGRVRAGETIITQRQLYGNAFRFMNELAPRLGIEVVWLDDVSPAAWEEAFDRNPRATLAYVETPANPTMLIVDLQGVAQVAHAHDAWVMVDNTFATPYHQRPLTWGCDVVIHSTTKYLSGHGLIIGGAIISTHLDYMSYSGQGVGLTAKMFGASPSPFDAWLANIGLKTFELRMQRHAENGMAIARWLAEHPKVERVYYPGLPSHPGYEIACKQMVNGFGGMISFEVKGGYDAGVTVMNHVQLATLAVSLGNVDTLIEHPASMTHSAVPRAERELAGISDGLVRLSVGIENVEDLIADLDQALARVKV